MPAELSLREVLLRFIRLLKLLFDDLGVREIDGLLVLIELPMREVLLWLIRLLVLLVDDLGVVVTDDLLVLIGLAMLEVLLWLIWLRVLVVGDFLTLDPEFANILPLKELPDLLALELVEVED